MRYFKLLTDSPNPKELDITTTKILFHDISGLGFDEDNTFRALGDVWWLDKTAYQQTPVSGKIVFTEEGNTSPYAKYQEFVRFISDPPLILLYYPFGPDSKVYRRRIRVGKIGKTEINQYGVLDIDVEFVPYTPWYEVFTRDIDPGEQEESFDEGWIWGGSSNPPLKFEPTKAEVDGGLARRAKFRGEALKRVTFEGVTTSRDNPVKLTIYGPVTKPEWIQYVNGERYASGGFIGTFILEAGEYLVVDNTSGQYVMKVYDEGTGAEKRNVYPIRDFDKECFLNLKKGNNAISISTSDGKGVRFSVEGHIYYATV